MTDAPRAESPGPRISVVIPARNEAGSLPELVEELAGVLSDRAFEMILVDDGSTDDTATVARNLASTRSWFRAIRHRESCGKSAALWSGLWVAKGSIVVTVDGDGQNDPAYVPELIQALEDGGGTCGLVAGQRLRRYDSRAKQVASRLANKVRGGLLKDNTRDTACGLKAIRRDIYRALPYFDTMHRFLPALVIREGYSVRHVDVVDRKRSRGVSKYGIRDRLSVGIPDLFGVWWLCRRRERIPRIVDVIGDE